MKQRILTILAVLTIGLAYDGMSQTTSTAGYIYPVKNVSSANQIWVIGQRPYNASGQLVGRGDIGQQLRQIFGNIKTALASVQLTAANIKQITYNVRQLDSQRTTVINQIREAVLPSLPGAIVQLKSIPRLPGDDMLIEVEIVAIGP